MYRTSSSVPSLCTCELEGDVRPFLAAIAGAAITDLTIEPARLEEAFLEYYADEEPAPPTDAAATGSRVNLAAVPPRAAPVRLRLVLVTVALTFWGMLMPIIYGRSASEMKTLFEQFPQMGQFANFGGGNLFTLPGSIAVGYIHPIAIALLSVFAIAFPLAAVAGERQRGTLEVVLARPISRRTYYLTLYLAAVLFLGDPDRGLAARDAGAGWPDGHDR